MIHGTNRRIGNGDGHPHCNGMSAGAGRPSSSPGQTDAALADVVVSASAASSDW
jgi:hypothetical protein